MELTLPQNKQRHDAPPVLERIGKADKTAVEECLNKYGGLVWALARKFTSSDKEAEAATLEIFRDIWRFAERFDTNVCSDKNFIAVISLQRLLKDEG